MSVILNPDTVEVYKFPESGIVALCREVADFVQSGQADRHELDIRNAYYEQIFEPDQPMIKVVFPRLKDRL